jgi:hypothetical protein
MQSIEPQIRCIRPKPNFVPLRHRDTNRVFDGMEADAN